MTTRDAASAAGKALNRSVSVRDVERITRAWGVDTLPPKKQGRLVWSQANVERLIECLSTKVGAA